jgi:hypothetical protein
VVRGWGGGGGVCTVFVFVEQVHQRAQLGRAHADAKGLAQLVLEHHGRHAALEVGQGHVAPVRVPAHRHLPQSPHDALHVLAGERLAHLG